LADTAGEKRAEQGALQPAKRWWRVFLVGLLLNVLYVLVYLVTDSNNLLPTILILGAFLVPVTFVIYLAERIPPHVIPLSVLAWCAFWGSMFAPPIALLVLSRINLLGATIGWLAVGPVEQSAKLVVPLLFYFLGRYRSEAAGLLIGVSAGMGFAVVESMGNGLNDVLAAEDNIIGPLELDLLERALLSPAGHIAWTGIICAVLWRERERAGHVTFNLKVLATFVVVILLHDLFDLGAFFVEGEPPEELGLVMSSEVAGIAYWGGLAVFLIIAIVSLVLFFYRLREARRALAASDASDLGDVAGTPSAP
jgi:protease PrsW